MFSKNKHLEEELKDIKEKYESAKLDKAITDRNNLILININAELNRTLMAIEEEISKNQYGSVNNLQSKLKKILADGKSNLVP